MDDRYREVKKYVSIKGEAFLGRLVAHPKPVDIKNLFELQCNKTKKLVTTICYTNPISGHELVQNGSLHACSN